MAAAAPPPALSPAGPRRREAAAVAAASSGGALTKDGGGRAGPAGAPPVAPRCPPVSTGRGRGRGAPPAAAGPGRGPALPCPAVLCCAGRRAAAGGGCARPAYSAGVCGKCGPAVSPGAPRSVGVCRGGVSSVLAWPHRALVSPCAPQHRSPQRKCTRELAVGLWRQPVIDVSRSPFPCALNSGPTLRCTESPITPPYLALRFLSQTLPPRGKHTSRST